MSKRPIGRPNAHLHALDDPIMIQVVGGAYRDRTDDPLLAKQVLSQLS